MLRPLRMLRETNDNKFSPTGDRRSSSTIYSADSMPDAFDILFSRVWWQYQAEDEQWFSILYHWFNILEGAAWCVFSALVIRRYQSHHRSRLELCYAFAFLTFALSDFGEAWRQTSWLLWLKLINLILLFLLRRHIMSRHYPDATVY